MRRAIRFLLVSAAAAAAATWMVVAAVTAPLQILALAAGAVTLRTLGPRPLRPPARPAPADEASGRDLHPASVIALVLAAAAVVLALPVWWELFTQAGPVVPGWRGWAWVVGSALGAVAIGTSVQVEQAAQHEAGDAGPARVALAVGTSGALVTVAAWAVAAAL